MASRTRRDDEVIRSPKWLHEPLADDEVVESLGWLSKPLADDARSIAALRLLFGSGLLTF